MAGIMACMQLVILLLFLPFVRSSDTTVIPADKSQLSSWFNQNVGPASVRKGSLEPALEAAEAGAKVIKVRTDGSGDFKTVNDAIKSIPTGNKDRVILWIGPGNYTEKIKIDRYKPFITFYGDSNNMPSLIYDGTAAEYGTVDSATLIVESDYFSAVNVKIVNSAPRPDGVRKGAQAVALRIGGDKASFYNCKIYGFQDTLCDDKGKHFFKDCYIEGTVDFIFGSGRSLYLNTETYVIPGDGMAMITAQARTKVDESNGYVFAHCKVTGTGNHAYLGRAWMPYARVVYAYSEFSDAVNPEGWSNNLNAQNNKTVYFGEYNNKGPGSAQGKRAGFTKKLNDAEAKQFITLGFIEGSKWLLPPTKL
ncbi:pectinesterase 2-like [Primulina eburnea]|uniref:pectinesterase 2-like n=1 Tax=Primulina eburnea TaxID=1245227 RepID=UPI003C6C60AB